MIVFTICLFYDFGAVIGYNESRGEQKSDMFTPGYIALLESGELQRRINVLRRILRSCELCPRKCRVDRLAGERGYCRAGKDLEISSYGPHFGEETIREIEQVRADMPRLADMLAAKCNGLTILSVQQVKGGKEKETEETLFIMTVCRTGPMY